jgi:hydroxypyruvate isomerase
MIKFAPNISWLFPDLDFCKRPQAVVAAGFDAFEFGFYGQANIDAIIAARHEFGLQVVLFNMDVSPWDRFERGFLADPSRKSEFKVELDKALELAGRLTALKIMLPVGAKLPGTPSELQTQCVIENLIYAAPLAKHADVILTIEALCENDFPDYFLTSSLLGLEIVRMVNHPYVKFQFDSYHLQMMEGHLTQTLINNIDAIGHIQFGDAPGRTEPGNGEINFGYLMHVVESAGYDDYIGLEYVPVSKGTNTFSWIPGR